MAVLRRWRKNNQVLRLAKTLGGAVDSVESLFDSSKQAALQELLDLSEADSECAEVIRAQAMDRAALADIYQRLVAVGAGQWVGYHYVPVSTLAYAKLLALAAEGLLSAESRSDVERVAVGIIRAVERGRFS